MTGRSRRTQCGAIADLGPTLWFLLLCVTFPLLDLTTVAIRYTFALAASRDAAQVAGNAKTFQTDISPTDLSVVDAAQSRAASDSADFTGVHLRNVQSYLLITNLATNSVTRQSTPLAAPADSTVNLYQIEVQVTADVDPLLTYRNNFITNLPGLTGPARFVISSVQMCENPSGMNQ